NVAARTAVALTIALRVILISSIPLIYSRARRSPRTRSDDCAKGVEGHRQSSGLAIFREACQRGAYIRVIGMRRKGLLKRGPGGVRVSGGMQSDTVRIREAGVC